MFEKIHTFVIGNTFLSGIFNLVYSPIQKQLDKLKETLSENSYTNIEEMLDKIAGISLILLSIYIVYSIFYFIYAVIVKRKIKIGILISIAVSIPFLLLFYVVYAYIHSNG